MRYTEKHLNAYLVEHGDGSLSRLFGMVDAADPMSTSGDIVKVIQFIRKLNQPSTESLRVAYLQKLLRHGVPFVRVEACMALIPFVRQLQYHIIEEMLENEGNLMVCTAMEALMREIRHQTAERRKTLKPGHNYLDNYTCSQCGGKADGAFKTCPALDPETFLRCMSESEELVSFRYFNHVGFSSIRRAVPKRVEFLETEYYPEQWILEAWDLDRLEIRRFAVKHISEWKALNVVLDSKGEKKW